jgi:LmbE family N-acetylglucosaminyl deacetylase
MNVLVLAPHPDDESLGCGGALSLHAQRGHRAAVAFLSSGEAGLEDFTREAAAAVREREAEDAAAVLGVANIDFLRYPDGLLSRQLPALTASIRVLVTKVGPDRIYVPNDREAHPDHIATHRALVAALKQSSMVGVEVLEYEVWSPLDWFDVVEDISDVLETKLAAVACHRSQTAKMDFVRAVRGLNEYRGAISWGCASAEVFRYLRT